MSRIDISLRLMLAAAAAGIGLGGSRAAAQVAPSAQSSLLLGSGVHGGRVEVSLPSVAGFTPYVSGLFLQRTSTGLNAASVGISRRFESGPWSAAPFAELGYGHLSTTVDGGGFWYVNGGAPQYQPYLQPADAWHVGGGAGLRLARGIAAGFAIEATAAYWGFGTPAHAIGDVNSFYGGLGIRYHW